MTSVQKQEFKASVDEVFEQEIDASEICNEIVNKAIEMELDLPRNFILFNRGRAFLENQIRDTNLELDEWDPAKKVKREDSLGIFASLIKWKLGKDMVKSFFRLQNSEDALVDREMVSRLVRHGLFNRGASSSAKEKSG